MTTIIPVRPPVSSRSFKIGAQTRRYWGQHEGVMAFAIVCERDFGAQSP
jgi:hypothetical protein